MQYLKTRIYNNDRIIVSHTAVKILWFRECNIERIYSEIKNNFKSSVET